MTKTAIEPIVHRMGLDLLNLMHRVPEHDLGNAHALVLHAVHEELAAAGHDASSSHLGAIHSIAETEDGKTCLVDVTIDGRPEAARVSVLASELGAIWHHRAVVEDFAEQALDLICKPHQSVMVGSVEPRTDSRVELRLVDIRTGEIAWHAKPLSTCPEVLRSIAERSA